MKTVLTFLSCRAAATSNLPELEALWKKLGEAESQLKARSDECDRLRKVEGELSETVKQLSGSAVTMKQEHEAELLRLVKVEEALQKERDDAVAGLEAAKTSHQKELLAAQGQTGNAMEALLEIDDMLSGNSPPSCRHGTILCSIRTDIPLAHRRMLAQHPDGCHRCRRGE